MSKIETVKTIEFQLGFLDKALTELMILLLCMIRPDLERDQISYRFYRAMQQIPSLISNHPGKAE